MKDNKRTYMEQKKGAEKWEKQIKQAKEIKQAKIKNTNEENHLLFILGNFLNG